MEKTCNKPGCESTVLNFRMNYCCKTHQRSHAGSLGGIAARGIPKKKYKAPKPEKVKAEPIPKRQKKRQLLITGSGLLKNKKGPSKLLHFGLIKKQLKKFIKLL